MSATLKWKFLAGFALVFFAGLAAGAFLGAAQSRRHHRDFGHHRAMTERVRNRMQSQLDLTPEQVARTSPIFENTARQLEAIRAEMSQRVQEVLAASDRKLAPELTPQQRARLAELQAQHKVDRKDRAARRAR